MRLRRFTNRTTIQRLASHTRGPAFIPPKPVFEAYPETQEHEIPCEINLGTDHSDVRAPQFVGESITWATSNRLNQYTRLLGYPPLVEEIAQIYGEKMNTFVDPLSEVLVTPGATGGFNAIIWSILGEGDEVVVIEPFNYPWIAALRQRGVVVKTVGFDDMGLLDLEALDETITDKTNMLLIDNPSLADGNLMRPNELRDVAGIVQRYRKLNVVVNESMHLQTKNYDEHFSFASLPRMFDSTFTLYSGGMEFDCRGLRVGWIIAPSRFIPHIGTYQAAAYYGCQTMAMVSLEFCCYIFNFFLNFFPLVFFC